MKRNLTRLLGGLLLFLSVTLGLSAQPAYEGTTFDSLQILADDGVLFFGVVLIAAVAVTAFFLGRKWVKRI